MSLPSNDLIINLKFRPVVYRIFFLILLFCLFAEIVILRVHFHELASPEWYKGLVKIVLSSLIPIALFVRTLTFFLPKLYCHYQVDHSKLTILRREQKTELFFSQIESVRLSKWSPRFLGGFELTFQNGDVFRFLPLLENSHLLLQRVYLSSPTLLSRDSYEKFLAQFRMTDHSWARIRSKIINWRALSIKFLVYPLIVTGLCYYQGWRWPADSPAFDQFLWLFLILFTLNICTALILNHFEERMNLFHQLKNSLHEVKRDPVYEALIERAFHGIHGVVTLFLTFIFLF